MLKRLAPVVIFLAVGAFVGAILGLIFVGDPAYGTVATVAFLVFLGVIIARGLSLNVSTLGHALARVESVQRAGASTNDLQLCTLRLRVQPPRGAPYDASTEYFMTEPQLRTIVPGAVLVVMRHPDGGLSVVSEPPAEWLARAESARRDPSAFSSSAGGPSSVGPTPARRLPVIACVAIIAVGAALTLIPAYGSISRAVESIAVGDWDGTSMTTGNYQQLAVDAIAEVAGGYEFTSIQFYDQYVIAVAPTFPGADTTDRYMWRYGHAFRDGPDLIQEDDLQGTLFDASGLDFSVVGEVTRVALANSAIDGVEGAYPRVAGAGVPRISVYLSGTYKDESLTYDFEGELLESR